MKTKKTPLPQLQHVCGTDELRPHFEFIHITKEFIRATDAYVCVEIQTKALFDPVIFDQIGMEAFSVHKSEWPKIQLAESTNSIQANSFIKEASALYFTVPSKRFVSIEPAQPGPDFEKWLKSHKKLHKYESMAPAVFGLDLNVAFNIQRALPKVRSWKIHLATKPNDPLLLKPQVHSYGRWLDEQIKVWLMPCEIAL